LVKGRLTAAIADVSRYTDSRRSRDYLPSMDVDDEGEVVGPDLLKAGPTQRLAEILPEPPPANRDAQERRYRDRDL